MTQLDFTPSAAAPEPEPEPATIRTPGPPPHWTPPPNRTPSPVPPRRWRARAAAGLAAVVVALSAGATGGYLAHRVDGSPATRAGSGASATATVVGRDDLAAVAARVEPSVVSINTGSAEGSGVVLSADGYVLTNNHVVATARAGTVRLTFSDGKTATATVIGTDPAADIAVVKAAGVSGLTAATFGDSGQVQVGDAVLAIGSPLGLDGTVTAGIISALHRDLGSAQGGGARSAQSSTITDAIQTDAAINPGNSGGALVDTAGRVIGINTAIATDGQSDSNLGVGFAIPGNAAKKVADRLISAQR
jgi:putative serine protease PepD